MEPVIDKHIEKRPTRGGDQRAYVAGTRIRVQDVAAEHELHGLTPEQIAREHPSLSLAQVHAALAYYFDHRDEIQKEIREDCDLVHEVRTETGPGPFERKVKGNGGQK